MGCLIGLGGLIAPRVIMVLLWLFGDYLSRAYDSWIWPLIGFFLLPTTTLAYAYAENRTPRGPIGAVGVVIIVLGFCLDAGIWGGGRGVLRMGGSSKT